QPYQSLSHFAVVVKLPVHHNRHIVRLIPDRLVPASKINNAQPAHSKPEPGSARIIYKKTGIVRPAMAHRLGHSSHLRLRVRATRDECDATNAAHLLFDPRRFQKGVSSSCEMFAQVETRYLQSAIGKPGKHFSH